jgi:ABC-type cobalamin/Fe3+-siderophores transport system ATPase subunit
MVNDIRVENATVSYRTHIALHDISLRIPSGSFCAVIGPNGAGKTTLLTLINGLGRLENGLVEIGGVRLEPANVRSIRLMCGYVPQQSDVDARMPISVRECVAMGRYGNRGLFRRLRAGDHAVIDDAIATVGLQRLQSRPVGQISGGERQKAALARAIVQGPRILLLDEPTANLDPKARLDIMRIVSDYYRQTHCTVVMVTHSLDHVPVCCNQAVLIKNARIADSGALENVCTTQTLSALYDCPLRLETHGSIRYALPAEEEVPHD